MANLDRQLALWRALRGATNGIGLLELSKRLGVSKNTVQRDLDKLSTAGIPITEETVGQRIYYRIQESSPPAARLSRTEARALAAAKAALGPLRRTPLYREYESALTKLEAAAASRAFATAGPEALVVPSAEVVDGLVEATLTNRRIRVTYTPRWSTAPRSLVLEPLGLAFHGGLAYLRARRPPYRNVVPYPAHRIGRIEMLDVTFTPGRVPRSAFGVFEGQPERVVARFHPDIAGYIAERKWHPSQKLKAEADGWLRFQGRVSGMWEFVGWLMSWGDNAELVEPKEWREEVRRRAKKMVETHE